MAHLHIAVHALKKTAMDQPNNVTTYKLLISCSRLWVTTTSLIRLPFRIIHLIQHLVRVCLIKVLQLMSSCSWCKSSQNVIHDLRWRGEGSRYLYFARYFMVNVSTSLELDLPDVALLNNHIRYWKSMTAVMSINHVSCFQERWQSKAELNAYLYCNIFTSPLTIMTFTKPSKYSVWY